MLDAPGRLSTMMDWPRLAPASGAIMRKTMSVPPPGA
jgi:hypothetical protein